MDQATRRIVIFVISTLVAAASHYLAWNLWAVPKLALLGSQVGDVATKGMADVVDAYNDTFKKPSDESSRRMRETSEKARAATSEISSQYHLARQRRLVAVVTLDIVLFLLGLALLNWRIPAVMTQKEDET